MPLMNNLINSIITQCLYNSKHNQQIPLHHACIVLLFGANIINLFYLFCRCTQSVKKWVGVYSKCQESGLELSSSGQLTLGDIELL
jgi:hypothetical protein